MRDTAREPGAGLTRFFGFSISSFSLSSISSLGTVSVLGDVVDFVAPYLSRLLGTGFLETDFCLTGDGAAMPGRMAVVESRWLENLSIVAPIICVRIRCGILLTRISRRVRKPFA